jgi:hypothetical protein
VFSLSYIYIYIYPKFVTEHLSLQEFTYRREPKDKQRNRSLNTMELDLSVFRQAQRAEIYPYHYTELYPYQCLLH